ncbi:MAG: Xaa-Pro peptidase family protein [Deltaproteobacteria bacterium]|nr:Xaa-Pro peptidase family protein [Deltaproteobacteria bacterium]
MIEAPFPQEEYEARHKELQQRMERDELDLIVASARDNFWYFTGLVSYQFDHLMRPEICFIPREGKPFALVYGNNKGKAEELPWFGEVRSYVDVPFPREMISDFLSDMGYGSARLGFELDDDQRLGFPVNYLTRLTEALPKAKIEDGSRALTEQRLYKSPREMENMRKACDISQRAYDRMLPELKAGVTRREVAERLYIAMIEEGAHPRHPGFLMLNASTKYDERRYEKGDRMIADFGACYEGYYGDITRQAIFGAPSADQTKEHALALHLIQQCKKVMKPGNSIAEIPRVANAELKRNGYPEVESPKRIGHGIGMARAEPPSISEAEVRNVEVGMVLAIEPKVRIPGASIHLEEDVFITADGAEPLTAGAERLDIIE